MWTRYYWLRSPDDIIREIKHYIQRYDITSIQLYDLTAIAGFCNRRYSVSGFKFQVSSFSSQSQKHET